MSEQQKYWGMNREQLLAANAALTAENAALRQRCEKLETFVDHALQNYSWDCASEPDGGDLQDKAEELGLIELRPIPRGDSIDGETEHYFTIWTPINAALSTPGGEDKKG